MAAVWEGGEEGSVSTSLPDGASRPEHVRERSPPRPFGPGRTPLASQLYLPPTSDFPCASLEVTQVGEAWVRGTGPRNHGNR